MALTHLVGLAKNPVPSGAVVGLLKTHDGRALRFARWEANQSPRMGTVCLFGGRTEFIEKYFEAVADLRRRGFAVAMLDWRGQGGSDRLLGNPRKGYVRDFADFDADLARFMRDIVLPDCPPPYLGLAHSMGANILLRAAARANLWFDKIVLTAPMIRINRASLPTSLGMAKFVSSALCLLGASTAYVLDGSDDYGETWPFETNSLTTDRERYWRNNAIVAAEPLLGLGSATYGWLHQAFRSMQMINDPTHLAAIRVPILFVLGGDDKIADSQFVEGYAARLKLARSITLPYSRHEIMQERDDLRQQFWAAFDAFAGANAPGLVAMPAA
jgi:lysophospholipase